MTQSPQPLPAFFQLGYVVRDLQGGMETFKNRLGISDFITFEGPLTCYGRSSHVKVALGMFGDIQVELIEPSAEVPNLYLDRLPPDHHSARLHHLGFVSDDESGWNALQSSLRRNGLAQVAGGSHSLVEFSYVDSRADTGLYGEYMLLHDEGQALFDSVPREPEGERRNNGRFFQLGYVVRDLEAAMAAFAERQGVKDFLVLDNLKSPNYGRDVKVRAALAYMGDAVIELIEPDLDMPSIYRSVVPDDRASARLHHLGILARDESEWERMKTSVDRFGWPVSIRYSGVVADCIYADARDDFGHFIEFVHRKPDGWTFYEKVPRNG